MTVVGAVLVLAALGGFLVVGPTLGWRLATAVVALGCLVVPSVILVQWSDAHHPGIAGAAPVIHPFTVVVVLGALLLVDRESWGTWPVPLRLFVVALALGMATVWPRTPEAWSGIVHLVVAALAALVGAGVARGIHRDEPSGRLLAVALALITGAQVAMAGPQLMRHGTEAAAADREMFRLRGTFLHEGDMGKALVLLLVIALPLTRSKDVVTRRLAVASIGASIVALGLSVSRANILGAGAMLVVWALVDPRFRSVGRRIAAVGVVGVCFLPFAGPVLERFRSDPEGGSRPQLTQAAYEQIAQAPWFGTGPNAYVRVVGAHDRATSHGLPVHNTVLLMVAELGIPVAAIFVAAVLSGYRSAWRRRKAGGIAGDHAIALLVSAPALLLIGLTGWGLLKQPILPLWLFVLGFALAQIRPAASIVQPAETRAGAGSPAAASVGRRTAVNRGPAVGASP